MATVKKLFSRGILPIYKDRNIAVKDLNKWTKLTIQFEATESKVKCSSLYIVQCPHYASITHQTGLVVLAFGFHAKLISQFEKFITHDWLVDCVLGMQTVDHWASSPLIARHAYDHIDRNMIEMNLSQFVGNIVQSNASIEYQDWLDMKSGRRNQVEDYDGDDFQINQEANTFNNNKQLTHINNVNNQQQPEDLSPQKFLEQKTPSLERVRQCHSIEVLALNRDKLRLRVRSDSFFECRALVRDFGSRLGCHAAIERLHLRGIGPLTDEMALARHEIHLEQIIQAVAIYSPDFEEYLLEIRKKHLENAKQFRFI